VAEYLDSLITKLRVTAGLEDLPMPEEITFEEILFLRIAFEFSKLYRGDRSAEYVEHLDRLTPSFEDYSEIFMRLQSSSNRLVFSEWVKYSLQLAIEDEVTRRNLVSLMFTYIGQIGHSYNDYQHLLKYERVVINELDRRAVEFAIEGGDGLEAPSAEGEGGGDEQVIEIEIREFRDLA